MSAADVVHSARADGVNLSLSATGTIKATGEDAAVGRWIDQIREHKAGIVDLLRGGEEVPTPTAPDPAAHRTWLVRFRGRRPVQVTFVPEATRAEVLKRYSQATGADPYQPPDQAPTAPLTDQERAAIRAWLVGIGETDRATIAEVLERCERDQGARDYFLGRAATNSLKCGPCLYQMADLVTTLGS